MRSWAGTICGAAAAIVIFDLGLRPFYGETNSGRLTVVRQYAEGMATTHYVRNDPAPYMWRVTGNAPIDGAPEVLILGDSYILARQVRDDQTMGALIERRSRAEGRPLNVRQYGLSGGSAPAYAAAASALIVRWNPSWVVVVLPTNDLTDEALDKAPYWRMRFGGGDTVKTFPVPYIPRPTEGVFGPLIDFLKLRSALVNLLLFRWVLHMQHPTPPPLGARRVEDPRLSRVPQASVSLLARAYGNRLLIIHLPEVSMRFSQQITDQEVRLENASRSAGVPYASARDVLIGARSRFVLARGFGNTPPGEGHLNQTGHRLLAGVLWQLLAPRISAPHFGKSM